MRRAGMIAVLAAGLAGCAASPEPLAEPVAVAPAPQAVPDVYPPLPVIDTQPLVRIAPLYPLAAARSGQQGCVSTLVLVEADGRVSAVRTVDAQPPQTFESSAAKALHKWKFKPVAQRGWQPQTLHYTLSGASHQAPTCRDDWSVAELIERTGLEISE
ncbi:MAG: energy transducer TonB [Abyssibacter sp.]|uniref:energy transducer TonB n=1 Tax=Abyssibacter sp. TaxID=2320200 RepID=UPI0032197706